MTAIILAAAIHGLFIIVAFFRQGRLARSKANRILVTLLAVIIVVLTGRALYDRFGESHNEAFYTMDGIVFLFGPMLFWYVREVFGKPVRRPAFLFIPIIIFFLSLIPYYVHTGQVEAYHSFTVINPDLSQGNNAILDEPVFSPGPYAVNYHGNIINAHSMLVRLVGLLLNLFFIWKTIQVFHLFRKSLDARSRKELDFLRGVLVVAMIVFVLWIDDLLPYWGLNRFLNFTSNQNVWLALSIIVYGLSFFATLRPDLFKLDVKTKALANQSEKRGEYEALGQQVLKTLKEQQLYKNSQITLEELAASLDLEKSRVSQVIKHGLNTNFYDLISSLRLSEFMREVRKEENQNFTYEAIALNCGFRSKSNFYKCFKQAHAMSPRQYLARQNTD